ncbi:MAG: OmpA family protein [Gammaproteobacteria bacterium]
MKTSVKIILVTAVAVGLTACSSHRHHRGAGIADGGMGGANGEGAYAQGVGSGSGFEGGANCQVPQTAGANTQSYYFDFDSYQVNGQDVSRMQSIGQNLAGSHSAVKVVGNTDSRGSREYNIALGWRRAKAVASVLEQAGASQVNTDSNGAEKPIAFGSSESDYQCNRRVDIIGK